VKPGTVLLALPLLAGAAFAGRASDARRATPRAPAGAASLLGGFTAIAVQVLWLRADAAVMEGREDDALLAFTAITELEPQLISSNEYVARMFGFNIADGHADPAVRWSLGREGWRVLCRTVEHNPGEARAFAARGGYALRRLDGDPSMRAGFLREVDREGPLARACDDYDRAAELRPQWTEPWHGTAIASQRRGLELLMEGRYDEASARLARSRDAFDHVADVWRKDGDPALAPWIDLAEQNGRLAASLARICALPAADRARAYDELRREAAGANLPDLPK